MILKPGDLNKDQNPQTTWDDLSWELFENLENLDYQDKMKEKEKQSDVHKLREVFSYLFWTQSLWNYCYYTKSWQQCTDWSDLYSIIKYRWEDLIIKVWCWEFNTDVFNVWWISELKWLHTTPIPLFVVNQSDSYLADEDTKELRTQKPKEYLNQNAVIIVPKWWKAYFRGYWERKQPINFWEINIRDFKNTLNEWRLAILHKEFPNWQFQDCIDIIEDFQKMDFDKFYNTVWKNRQFIKDDYNKNNHKWYNMTKVLWCFWNMWTNRVWSWVWDIESFQSLYNLIKSFKIQEQSF